MDTPTIDEIRQAADRIRPYAHRTPVITCASLNHHTGAKLFLKCENFQKTGAFKFRGACNAVFALSDTEVTHGVATHSSGNFAQALALAARLRNIPAYIVMPDNSTAVKKAAVMEYGGQITFCKPTLDARDITLEQVVRETSSVFVHPFDNTQVIAGQGTAALEFLEDVPELDVIIAPLGGGGLLSGSAICVTELSPQIRILGAEPDMADDGYRSMQAGHIIPSVNPQTVADGLLTSLSELTFSIIRTRVEQIVTVSETGIIAAMRYIWERAKIIIEPSAAVPIGALLEHKINLTNLRVGVLLSGGNVDLDRLPWQEQQT